MNEIKLIAHRGGYKQSNTRENSIEAIKYATSKEYIDGVEFDVRVTSDNKLVVFHDFRIKYNNKSYRISNTDYSKLNQIHLKKYKTKLATLDEILSIIPKEKLIFLEIKLGEVGSEAQTLQLVYDTVKKYKTKKIVVISFIYKFLKFFIKRKYPTCLLLNRHSKLFELKAYFRTYLNLSLDIISMDKRMVNSKNSKMILKSNKNYGIYTIDNSDEVDKLFKEIGIDVIKKYKNKIYITTTNPKLIYERIEELNETFKKV